MRRIIVSIALLYLSSCVPIPFNNNTPPERETITWNSSDLATPPDYMVMTATNQGIYQIKNIQIANDYQSFANEIKSEDPDTHIIEELLKKGVDPSIVHEKVEDLAYPAIVYTHSDKKLKKLLQEYGATTRGLNQEIREYNNSNFIEASRRGDFKKLKYFHKQGVNIDATDEEYSLTALHHATMHNNKKIVSFLLKKGADPDLAISAIYDEKYEMILDLLLKKGADIDALDSWGRTRLLIAIEDDNEEFTKILLQRGADPKKLQIKDFGSYTFSYIKNPYIQKLLDTHIKSRDEYIFFLLRDEQYDNLQAQIESMEDVNITNYQGYTPLQLLATVDLFPFIPMILNKGADINKSNNFGWTPLHLAVNKGYLNTVNTLISEGADISIPNRHGSSPLDTATHYNYGDIMNVLMPTKKTP